MDNEKYSYQKEWEHYRWLVRSYFVTVLTYLPFIFLFTIENWTVLEKTLAVIGVLTFIANVIIYLNIIVWKCPRCGELYFRWWNRNAIFAKECKNCGLKKYEGSNIKGFFTDAT